MAGPVFPAADGRAHTWIDPSHGGRLPVCAALGACAAQGAQVRGGLVCVCRPEALHRTAGGRATRPSPPVLQTDAFWRQQTDMHPYPGKTLAGA